MIIIKSRRRSFWKRITSRGTIINSNKIHISKSIISLKAHPWKKDNSIEQNHETMRCVIRGKYLLNLFQLLMQRPKTPWSNYLKRIKRECTNLLKKDPAHSLVCLVRVQRIRLKDHRSRIHQCEKIETLWGYKEAVPKRNHHYKTAMKNHSLNQ